MSKKPTITIIITILLVAAGIFLLFAGVVSTVYIARKVRILTTDMTGGTSLVYEIDTRGLSEEDKKDLSRRMITALRRRIDPANIQNLIWLPLGNTRFEIRMPLAGPFNPQDIQRILKGTGMLEFRVLPTQGHPEVDMDLMQNYVNTLQEKGPRYSSDNKFIWCEIEKHEEWGARDREGRTSIVGQFGDKHYVLASNKPDETLLYSAGKGDWKLEKANPTQDQMGRRAISFLLDDKGGKLFSKVTGDNLGRPLCILLDKIAISAPMIQSRIGKQGIITGSFTKTEAEDIVNRLNAGSLPAKLIEQPISIKTIGPSIGAR